MCHVADTSCAIPRQTAAASAETCGVSAFAFQGTNAHVLLQRHAEPSETEMSFSNRRPIWQQKRWWFAPRPHFMLPGVTCSAAAAEFALLLSSGSLSFLWDHQVDVDTFRL